MIFVTGPMYSGKEKCICEMLGITHEEFMSRGVRDVEQLVADDATDGSWNVTGISDGPSWNETDTDDALTRLADELSKKDIIIASEIGAGVIPTDPGQDAHRQRAGRLSQLLSARADTVIRVICGLPQILKQGNEILHEAEGDEISSESKDNEISSEAKGSHKNSIMIAAMESGIGKTLFTCGLIRVLSAYGYAVFPYKTGPDYIDPMYLSRAAGTPCRNLDIFLQGEDGVCRSYMKAFATDAASKAGGSNGTKGSAAGEAENYAVIESAMGYYDGAGGTDEASAYGVAGLLEVPVVLLARPGKNSVTLAAQIKGILDFRKDSRIRCVVLTHCSAKRYENLKHVIERECGIRVAGFMPPMDEAKISSRHLGLVTADETDDLEHRFDAIKKAVEENVDVHYICSL